MIIHTQGRVQGSCKATLECLCTGVLYVYKGWCVPWLARPAQVTEKPAVSVMRGGSECILIAEDNEDLRDAAQEILQSLGYRVICAKDGAEALRIFEVEKDAIDLVFLDVVLPKLNGPEAYLHMAELKPGVPVVFTTGYASEVSMVPIKTRKKATVLQKPYGSQYLAQKLREKLDKRGPQ